MMQKLTLAEMSEELHVSPRTFRRMIAEKKLPYYQAGRRLLFDKEKVFDRLERNAESTAPLRRKPKADISQGRFAERLGLT